MRNAVIAGDNADLVSQTAKELSDMLGSRAQVRALGSTEGMIEPGDIFIYLVQNGADHDAMARIRGIIQSQQAPYCRSLECPAGQQTGKTQEALLKT